MLISEDYRQQNAELLENNPKYATSGNEFRAEVRRLSDWGRKEILDYGCGRALLQRALGPAYRVHNYDPCVPEYANPPQPAAIVYCGDVLEHVEPECLADVLADIRRCVKERGLFRICIRPSIKTLPDGRNTHLIVENQDWWEQRILEAGFTIVAKKEMEPQDTRTWLEVA